MNKLLAMGAGLLLALTAGADSGGSNEEAVTVRTVALEELLIYPEASAPATVLSLNDSTISAELSAVVESVSAQVGEIVDENAVLAELDCRDYQIAGDELWARLDAIDARIGFATTQLERAQALERTRTMTQEAIQQRESDLAALRAERDALEAQLDGNLRAQQKCTLRAPFRAIVVERLAGRGEYLVPGAPLFRLLDIGQLEVSSAVLDRDAPALAEASEVFFRYQGEDYPLKLRALSPALDPLNGSREARLRFLGDRTASPGATGRLIWRRPAALPADYLSLREGRLGVLLAKQNRARFYRLPGAQLGRPATVELPRWSRVITDGRLGLADGDLIDEVTD